MKKTNNIKLMLPVVGCDLFVLQVGTRAVCGCCAGGTLCQHHRKKSCGLEWDPTAEIQTGKFTFL